MKIIFSESRKKQLFGTEIEKNQKNINKSGFFPEPEPDRTGPDPNRTAPEPNRTEPNRRFPEHDDSRNLRILEIPEF